MELRRRPERGHHPRSGGRIRFVTVAAGVLAFAVLAASCDSGSSGSKSSGTSSSTAPAQQAAATPVGAEAAVASYLKSQGYDYAGDCATAKLPRDKGKWCSTLVKGNATSDTKTYAIGPVGGKPVKEITVTRHGKAQLTPGFQVGVAEGNVGLPQQLTAQQLAADIFITGNLILDQAAGIGKGLADLPGGIPNAGGPPGTGNPAGTPTVITPPPNNGGTQYPPQGDIVVNNPNVVVGSRAVAQGGGCAVNESLSVSFDGKPIGTIMSDAQGKFATSLTVPPGTVPGVHLLTVRGAVCVLNADITVLGANLAYTGSSSRTGTYVLAGVAAIVIGLVLVVGTRRRRQGVRGRSLPPASPSA